jgi:50S ribosomal protein L16 3-hydroxylase
VLSELHINWPDGLDENIFLKTYWQQQPLLISQALPSFDNPLDPNELAGLACDADANSRFMQRVQGNEWRMCGGPLSDDFFDDVTGHEWSLLVSDVEKLLPDFREYLQPFRFLPDWRIDDLMISYAPVGGSVGAHVDQYDVFLLQADGVREWQIEETPRTGHQPSVSASISLLADFKADRTMHLSAGDILYLPPGFAHHGIAKEDPCMTWSIGFRAPNAEEMLPSILRYLCESGHETLTARYTDKQRSATHRPGHISTDDIKALRNIVRNALAADDEILDLCIGRYLTESIDDSTETLTDSADWSSVKSLLKDNILVCNSQVKFATMSVNVANSDAFAVNDASAVISVSTHSEVSANDDAHVDMTTLLVNGEAYLCSDKLGNSLCEQRFCRESDIVTPQDQATVVELVNRQHLLSEQHDDQ